MVAVLVVVHGLVQAAPLAVAVPGLLAIAWSDATTHLIPNRLLARTVVAFGVLACGAEIAGSHGARTGLATAGLWFGVLALVHVLDPHLGFGDVKLGFALGLVLGWAAAVAGHGWDAAALTSAGAFVVACLVTLLVSSRGETPSLPGTPFAPALVATTLTVVIGFGLTS